MVFHDLYYMKFRSYDKGLVSAVSYDRGSTVNHYKITLSLQFKRKKAELVASIFAIFVEAQSSFFHVKFFFDPNFVVGWPFVNALNSYILKHLYERS